MLEMATTKPPWSQYEGVRKTGYNACIHLYESNACIYLYDRLFARVMFDLVLLIPFDSAKVAAMFKIGNSKELPPIPEYLSEDGKNFVRLCLQRNPLQRPTAAQLLEHPFVKNAAPLERPIVSAETSDGPPTATNAARSLV